ncbi:MAG: chemotaxis response regulator protein-glutamate methylesterase [Anaerovibrio sp.]|nr:chemotaxis response regulator protein-glutamate methylesterase [Anaerovibrio sp.]
MIRVVIADDSAFMRKVLSDLFEQTPDFQVVGKARNGKEAVELAAKEKPDLLTLDINMPVMDGLQALKVIMKDCPVPVLMFSSLTRRGADETITALELGAVDFLCKTGGSISRIDAIEDDILAKCRAVAAVGVNRSKNLGNIFSKKQEAPNLKRINIFERKGYSTASREKLSASVQQKAGLSDIMAKRDNPLLKPKASPSPYQGSASAGIKLVALGTSTGGPRALQHVIPKLPGNMPCGMVVVQHMPAGFTKSLADRLNSLSQVTVKEAENGEPVLPGHVYIAPGGYHLTVRGNSSHREISLNQDPPLASHRPAVDVMFDSVVKYGSDVVSVILTGMGCDGAAGMKKIKKAGGCVIAESEDSCVVYGMPKSVVESGIADEVLPVDRIADAIVKRVRN